MHKLLLIGCGKMGGSLLHGWQKEHAFTECYIVDPAPLTFTETNIFTFKTLADLPKNLSIDVVILAVKPQYMDDVLPPLALFKDSLFLSIAAGKTLSYFTKTLGEVALVRAMPNLPASIGAGITVCCANAQITEDHRTLCTTLLKAVGKVAWITDENQMDAVTAISGCGPAYLFLLAETLTKTAISLGLPENLATELARTTIIGSGKLLEHSQLSAAELRKNVASPGGATEQALKILMGEKGLQELLEKAANAAVKRSQELK